MSFNLLYATMLFMIKNDRRCGLLPLLSTFAFVVWLPTLALAKVVDANKVPIKVSKSSIAKNNVRPNKDDFSLTSLPETLYPLKKTKSGFVYEIDDIKNHKCNSAEYFLFKYDHPSYVIPGWIFNEGVGGSDGGHIKIVCGAEKKDDLVTVTLTSLDDPLCKKPDAKKMIIRRDKVKRFIYFVNPPVMNSEVWIDAKELSNVAKVVSDRPCEGDPQ